jgi:hypothetical protein
MHRTVPVGMTGLGCETPGYKAQYGPELRGSEEQRSRPASFEDGVGRIFFE